VAALAHLTAMDGGNAEGLQEQSLPCARAAIRGDQMQEVEQRMEQLPRVSVGLEAIIGEKWTKDRGRSKRGRQNWARFRDDFRGEQGEKCWKSLLKDQGFLGKGRLFFLFFYPPC
jgi:hypothetical protein